MGVWTMMIIACVTIIGVAIEAWQIKDALVAEARRDKQEKYRLLNQKIMEEIDREPDIVEAADFRWDEIERAIDQRKVLSYSSRS